MAFGGAQTDNKGGPTNAGTFQIADLITGLTLAARVGVFDATGAAADSGILTTKQGPPANSNSLPTGFGRGPGKWQTTDANFIDVTIFDGTDSGGGAVSNVTVSSIAVTSGDLVIGFHSRSAGAATGPLTILIKTLFPLVQ